MPKTGLLSNLRLIGVSSSIMSKNGSPLPGQVHHILKPVMLAVLVLGLPPGLGALVLKLNVINLQFLLQLDYQV